MNTQRRCMMIGKRMKPLYNHYYSNDKHSAKRKEQIRRDAFAWKVGIFAMTLVSMVGIAAIWWAATL